MNLRKRFLVQAIENDDFDYCNTSKAKKCVKIAENFAIGFFEWYMSNDTGKYNTTKELLEIYKKTL